MPIYSQICPLVSEEKIFKELICIIIGKTAPPRMGAPFIYGASLYLSNFGRGSLDESFMPIYSQICPLVSEEKIFKELICIIIGKKAPPPLGAPFIDGAGLFWQFW